MDSRQCEISDVNVFVRTKKNNVTRILCLSAYYSCYTYIYIILSIYKLFARF